MGFAVKFRDCEAAGNTMNELKGYGAPATNAGVASFRMWRIAGVEVYCAHRAPASADGLRLFNPGYLNRSFVLEEGLTAMWFRKRANYSKHVTENKTEGEISRIRLELRELKDQYAELARISSDVVAVLRSIEQHSGGLHYLMASWVMGRPFEEDGRLQDRKSLSRFNRKVYSQLGEDGIIAEIFARIGRVDGVFVECGIGNGLENTSRFLLEGGWCGYWFEGNQSDVHAARETFKEYIADGHLTIVNAFITADNINQLFDDAGVPAEFDYLSIDLDYVTPYIWEKIERRYRVACIEMNASLPQNMEMRMPYVADRLWDGTNAYGASLKTLEGIGRSRGMALVGCDMTGTNGFFVRDDEAEGKFREPFDADTHYEPPRNYYPYALHHPSPMSPRAWVRSEPPRK